MRPLFIVLEGLEGCGRAEQAPRLGRALREHGRKVFECADSRFGVWGAAARLWLAQDLDETKRPSTFPITTCTSAEEYLLACYVRARQDLSYEIQAALDSGHDVICNGWEQSTWASQLASGAPVSRVVRWLDQHPPVVQPDLVLWLRLPVAVAQRRLLFATGGVRARVSARFHTTDYLAAAATCYETLPGLTRVDAGDLPERVTSELLAHVSWALRNELDLTTPPSTVAHARALRTLSARLRARRARTPVPRRPVREAK